MRLRGRRLLLSAALLAMTFLQAVTTVSANGIGTVYVANEAANSISVIDTNTNTAVEVIPLKLPPLSLAFSPDAHWVYVSHRDSNVISFLDTSVEDVTSSVRLGGQLGQLAVTSAGAWLLAPDSKEGVLRVVDASSHNQLFAVPVGGQPETVAASADGSVAFVADRSSGLVSMVDLKNRAVVRTYQAAAGKHYLALSPAPSGQELLVTGDSGDELMAVDANSGQLKRTITLGPASGAAGFSPTGELAYIPRLGRAEVAIVNTTSGAPTGSISLQSQPAGLGISRDGKKGYVALTDKDLVAVMDLVQKSVIAQVPVESGPTAVAVSPLQTKPQPVVMPGALPNTGGGPVDRGKDWPLAGGLFILLAGTAAAVSRLRPRRR